MKQHLALALALLLLAGCGGGGGSSSVPGSTTTQAKTVTGSVVISIPTSAAQTSAAKVRYPQFVSPAASSVSLSINGAAATLFDVSATSSLCATVSGARNCTLTFGAPAGSDTFAFLIFSGANGTGTQLAAANVAQAILSGQAFNFAVALNAAVGTIVVSFTPVSGTGNCPNAPIGFNGFNEGCPGSAPLTITVNDPSGAAITGSAAFATPIQITTTEPTITVTPPQMTAPNQTETLSYTGVPWQSITNTLQVTLTAGGQTGSLTIFTQQSNLYVANANAPPGSTPPGGGNITVYRFGATTPLRTLTGGLSNPTTPKLDANGNLYVLDNGPYTTQSNPYINVYAPGASGAAAPIRQITGIAPLLSGQACNSMIFDPTGHYLYVVCGDAKIHIFNVPTAPTATATSLQTAVLGSDFFTAPVSTVFDGAGGLYVTDPGANSGEGAIFYFSAAQVAPTVNNPFMSPTNQMGPGTGWPIAGIAPIGVGMDTTGNLYSTISYFAASPGAPDTSNEIAVWKAASLPCSNCAPSTTFTGAPFTVHASAGGTLDPAGNLYISNPFQNQINVLARATVNVTGTVGNPAVLRTINTGSSPSAPTGLTIGP